MKRVMGVTLAMLLLAAAAMAQQDVSLPAGTGLRMKLETPLSTHKSKVGDVFTGRVTEAVVVNGATLVPVGAAVTGRVTKLSEPRRIAGKPTIALLPDRIVLPNGNEYLITATVVDTARSSHTTVDDEGRIHGSARSGRDNAEMVAGTGAGAVIGTLAAGATGLFVGAGVGFGLVGAHWLATKHSAQLPAGTEIFLELDRPLMMGGAGVAGE
ncbi:MAG: hypothetical protein WB347_19250 [Terriglobales bacterium]